MLPILLSLSLAVSVQSPRAADDGLEKSIAASRAKGIDYLKKQQKKDGTWETGALEVAGMTGGFTALVVLSLLEAGVAHDDPAIATAMPYLLKLKHEKSYVVSLQVQVLARLDRKKYAKDIQAGADWLMEKSISRAGKLEGWSYPSAQIADGSNTHFAVVALREAALAGAKVPDRTWDQIRKLYAESRGNDGWGYYGRMGQPATRTMTAAALTGLVMAAEFDKTGKGTDPAFDKGMASLLKGSPPRQGTSEVYEWFVTAELGRALATREFKSGDLVKPWYRDGAARLVKEQKINGSWEGKPGLDRSPMYATACALYFLGPPGERQ